MSCHIVLNLYLRAVGYSYSPALSLPAKMVSFMVLEVVFLSDIFSLFS